MHLSFARAAAAVVVGVALVASFGCGSGDGEGEPGEPVVGAGGRVAAGEGAGFTGAAGQGTGALGAGGASEGGGSSSLGGGSAGSGGVSVEPCEPVTCGACVKVVDDPLDGSTVGMRNGGSFTAGGWRTNNLNNRIVYDLQREIDCGAYELTVTNFNPPDQYTHRTEPVDCDDVDCYVHFLGWYQGDHGNHHTSANGCESGINVQATGVESGSFERHRRLKLKSSTFGWAGGGNSYTPKRSWDPGATYHLEVRWSSTEVVLRVDGVQQAAVQLEWPGDPGFEPSPAHCTGPADCRMKLRYFFLGRDHNPAGGYLAGPVYSNVKIYDCSG